MSIQLWTPPSFKKSTVRDRQQVKQILSSARKLDHVVLSDLAFNLSFSNNFIGFCVGKTITNGLQVQGGSCNPTPMGDIPSVDNMPSVKFEFPPNGGNVQANTEFTIVMVRSLARALVTLSLLTWLSEYQRNANRYLHQRCKHLLRRSSATE